MLSYTPEEYDAIMSEAIYGGVYRYIKTTEGLIKKYALGVGKELYSQNLEINLLVYADKSEIIIFLPKISSLTTVSGFKVIISDPLKTLTSNPLQLYCYPTDQFINYGSNQITIQSAGISEMFFVQDSNLWSSYSEYAFLKDFDMADWQPMAGGFYIDFNNGQNQKITLTDNVTLTLTPISVADSTASVRLTLYQDAVGGRNVILPSNCEYFDFVFTEGTANQFAIMTLYWNAVFWTAMCTEWKNIPS